MARSAANQKRRVAPPYGPAKGMIQALHVLQRVTPAEVNDEFLKANNIAPGNEYKVVGALKFLGLVDEEGRPTEKCRLLKTRGATYTLALQEMVRSAYSDLFRHLAPREASREQIYNYFVTQGGIGSEMAVKATRFFIDLCEMAEIELAVKTGTRVSRRSKAQAAATLGSGKVAEPSAESSLLSVDSREIGVPPLLLAITPEVARMDEERLAELFRKIRAAWRKASHE